VAPATFCPEIIHNKSIDAICQHEGEGALKGPMDILDDYGNLGPAEKIENLWVKKNGKVYQNGIRNLTENLDLISPMDRDIYYRRYRTLRTRPTKTLYMGRGCPFACTYCFNHVLKKMVKQKGKYVRLRSIDNVFAEIQYLKGKYGLKWVHFNDDTMNFRRTWVDEFLERYSKEIGIPFLCNVRVGFLDEDLVRKLKKAGCDRVNFGVEHGSFEIRKNLFKR
jgi:radical SAM superfamily enzyme YgiQ (UPF0313 family)